MDNYARPLPATGHAEALSEHMRSKEAPNEPPPPPALSWARGGGGSRARTGAQGPRQLYGSESDEKRPSGTCQLSTRTAAAAGDPALHLGKKEGPAWDTCNATALHVGTGDTSSWRGSHRNRSRWRKARASRLAPETSVQTHSPPRDPAEGPEGGLREPRSPPHLHS